MAFTCSIAKEKNRAASQYPKRRLSLRSRKVSKPRDLYLELPDHSEIWQALRQQCCRCACQISKRYDNSKCQSRGFETLRDLTERRLFGYWDGAQIVFGEKGSYRCVFWNRFSNMTTELRIRLRPPLLTGVNFNPRMEINHIQYKVRDAAVEVWEFVRNFILHFTGYVVTSPSCG